MIWSRLSRCAPLHLLNPIPHQQHRRLLTSFFLERGHRDDRERRPRHEDGMHRDKGRDYGHREHRGGRDRDAERNSDREHGHRDGEPMVTVI